MFSGQFVAQGFTKVPNEIFKKAEGTILYVYKKLALPSEQIRINKTSDDADFVIVACPILNAHLHDVNYRPLLRYEAESAMVDGTFEEIQLGKMEGLRFFGKKSVLINWIVELRDLLEYEYQNRIVRICYQNLSGNDKKLCSVWLISKEMFFLNMKSLCQKRPVNGLIPKLLCPW